MIEIVIPSRTSDLGNDFKVRRTLPYAKKRMVGPFIFFDHLGPANITEQNGLSVRAHPHIGLATLTYLFSGEITHRDTLGNEQIIRPHEVNWMTAGRGIAHSERSRRSEQSKLLEGLQVWIALPKEIEDIEPNFNHFEVSDIPSVDVGNNKFKLIAGKAFGKKSPVPVYSPLFYLVGDMSAQDIFAMDLDAEVEGAVYVAKGQLNCDHKIYEEGTFICFHKGTSINFMAQVDAHVIILGGEVFPEKRFIWWNFVSSSEAKIEIAKMRWSNHDFGKVINEEEEIPLPKELQVYRNEAVEYP